MIFGDVLYEVKEKVAVIMLNRADQYNAISKSMPDDLHNAFEYANDDDNAHMVVLKGAGKGFCSGYDLNVFTQKTKDNPIHQDMPWDAMIDYKFMHNCTKKFMSIWRCSKPVIAAVHGDAIAGGSDIALCCDLVLMNEKARIGYPPARVWGCPTTAMWSYRLGLEKSKYMLFTGDLISGKKAAEIGLIYKATPSKDLEEEVHNIADRIKSVPKNQLMMMKMLVNQAYENMGLAHTQTIATLFDGIARHTPEGIKFRDCVHKSGFKVAIHNRDG